MRAERVRVKSKKISAASDMELAKKGVPAKPQGFVGRRSGSPSSDAAIRI